MFAQFDLFFCPVRLILVQLDLFLCVSLYLYAVQFIFVRFDSFVCGSIYFCAGSIQFLCGSIHFLGRSIYFCVVRFIFCCFDILTDFRFICVRFILFILDLKILSVTERRNMWMVFMSLVFDLIGQLNCHVNGCKTR